MSEVFFAEFFFSAYLIRPIYTCPFAHVYFPGALSRSQQPVFLNPIQTLAAVPPPRHTIPQ